MKLQQITVRGTVLHYAVVDRGHDEYVPYTEFYPWIQKKTRRKYWLFGPIVEYDEPMFAFEVDFDILDVNYPKSRVKAAVEKAYDLWIELRERPGQIVRGEII